MIMMMTIIVIPPNTLQKQVGCFNHRVVIPGCRQTGETVVMKGLLGVED